MSVKREEVFFNGDCKISKERPESRFVYTSLEFICLVCIDLSGPNTIGPGNSIIEINT